MEFYISNLEVPNAIYFSEDGTHFDSGDSYDLRPRLRNCVSAHPAHYFIFKSDLLRGNEMVGDGEIPARHSDWHEKIYVDNQEYFIAAPLKFRRVRDHLCRRGASDQ